MTDSYPLGYRCHARVPVQWVGDGWVHWREPIDMDGVYVEPIELIHSAPAASVTTSWPWIVAGLLVVIWAGWSLA